MVTKTNKKLIKSKTIKISKSTIVNRIYEKKVVQKHNLNKSQIELVINDFLIELKHSLVHGEEIRLPSYFTLKTVITKPRVAMNLKTKDKMNIPAKNLPKIVFSKDFKEIVNNSKK